MAKHTIHHSCGHSQEYQLFGKSSERTRKIEWLEGRLCTECKKLETDKARAEAAQQAAVEADENGLPALQGSEKQISWAETIRKNCLANLAKVEAFAEASIKEQRDAMFEVAQEAFDAIKAQDSAHWWIENRDAGLFISSRDFIIWLLGGIEYGRLPEDQLAARARYHFGGMTRPSAQDPAVSPIVADAKAEATVRPESPLTESVAEIHIAGQEVQVAFPEKIEEFRLLMRGHGYEWRNGYWGRTLNSRNGTTDDRAAEIGNAILKAGFIIRCFMPDIRVKAIAAEFEPEHTRWILRIIKGDYAGWFAIQWHHEDDFYDAARRLPRSRYAKPFVVVPSEFFEEVMDFAGRYDFKIAKSAQDLADQARANKEAALISRPADKPRPKPVRVGTAKPPKLAKQTEDAIDDELKD